MKTEIPTPRTDEKAFDLNHVYDTGWTEYRPDGVYVDSDFCRSLERENAALREWIKSEGERTNVCTYHILKEICSTCNCDRANPKKS